MMPSKVRPQEKKLISTTQALAEQIKAAVELEVASLGLNASDQISFTNMDRVNEGVANAVPSSLALSKNTVLEGDQSLIIGMLSASDDADTAGLRYSIADVSGSDHAAFQIRRGNELHLRQAADFETKSTFIVYIDVTDQGGKSLRSAFTITVTNVNEAPSITSGATASFAENDTGTVYTAMATDPDAGTTLVYTLDGTDANLFDIDASTGAVTFKSAPNFEAPADAGADNIYDITVTATDDGKGNLSDTKAVAITVINVNDAPVGVTDTLSATEDRSVTYAASDLLGNDTDADGKTLSIKSVASGTGGTAVLNQDGTVTFTPTANFNGAASFSYIATDGTADTASTTVTLNVAAVNDAPVIVSGATGSVAENAASSTVIYTAQASDVDTGTVTITGTAQEDQTLTAVSTLADEDGLGALSYQWLADGVAIAGATANQYTLSEVNIGSQISLNVEYVDSGGTLEAVASEPIGPVEKLINTIVVSGSINGARGTGVGSVEVTMTTLNLPVQQTVSDGSGDFTFTTEPPEGAIVTADKAIDDLSQDALGAFDALQALRLAVGLTKSDGTAEWHDYIAADINKDGRVGADDALNILKYAVGLTDGPSIDWVFVDSDADWSGVNRSNTSYDEGISLGDIVTDTGLSMTAILVGDVSGTVGAANDAPVGVADTLSATEDTAVTYAAADLLGNDTDADGNTLSIKSVSSITGGTAVLNQDGTVTFTPTANFNGAASFSYIATDGTADTASTTVTVNVAAVNDAPVIVSGATGSVAENAASSTVIYTAQASDVDTGTTLTYSLGGADASLLDIDPSTGAVTLKASANFEAKSSYSFNVIATDNGTGSLSDTKAVSVNITDVNEAPTADGTVAAQTAVNGQLFSLDVGGYFADVDAGNNGTLTYSATGLPSGITIDSSTGVISGTASADRSSAAVVVTATDGGSLFATQSFDLGVVSAPAITGLASNVAVAKSGDALTLTATVSEAVIVNTSGGTPTLTLDVGGQTLTATYSGGSGTTSLTFTATAGAGNDNTVSVTAINLNGGTITGNTTAQGLLTTATGQVVPSFIVDNTNPSFTSGATANFAENGSGTAYASAVTDATTVTYTLGGTDAALFNISSTGAVTFKTAPDFEAAGDNGSNNVYDVTVTATDAAGNQNTQAVAITVTNVNEAPSITSGATASFAENDTGTVYTATATDPDAGTTLVYTLGGTDANLFDIDASTGVVTFKSAPNFEAPADAGADNIYDITVTATDDGTGSLSNTKAVSVSVTDVNEAVEVASTFISAGLRVSVASDLVVSFQEEVVRGDGDIYILSEDNSIFHTITAADEISIDGKTVRINLANDLSPNTLGYGIRFSDGAFKTKSTNQEISEKQFFGAEGFNTGNIIYAQPLSTNSNTTGSGTIDDPYLSLGTAAESATAGDTVYVFDPDNQTIRDYSYTLSADLLGAPGQEIYIKPAPSATGVVEFIGQNNWILDGAQYVVIEGFNFDGNSDSVTVEEMLTTTYWDQTANDSLGGIAINIKDADYITVRDNYFHDLYQKAVNIQDGRYVNVWGNIIENVATRSLSGGHGIMRQQNYGDFGTDESGALRWDLSGNLIFNTYQSVYSWVPSKGYLNMILDEGKPILIDEPTNFANQVMTARISENIIAYADVDSIRIKSTPGLEVSNNSIYAQGSHADGITDRDTTGGIAFPNFSLIDNLVQTGTGTQAIEVNDAIAGNDYTINGNLISGGTATPGMTGVSSTTSDLFTDPTAGDFSAAVTTTAGVSDATLADLARQVSKWSVNVVPDNHMIDEKYFVQIMLDNIPGIRDGDATDGTIFDTLGTYADSNLESGQKAFNFEFADGAGSLVNIGTATTTEITLPLVYSNWYDALANEYSNQNYSLIRSGHTYLAQEQVLGNSDLLAFDLENATDYEQMQAASSAVVDVTLDGDLLLDFSNYSGTLSFNQTFDLIVADNITGSFDEVLTKGLENFRIETSLQTNASGDDKYVAKVVPLPPGFTVSTSSVEVREGASTSFTVVLDAPPTEDVTLLLTTNDGTASSLSASSLVFTRSNWNTEQTVTLNGVQDAIDDGAQSSQITITVDDANSDNDFDALADKTISVSTIDDDTAGIVLSTESLTLEEGGTNASFTLKLASKPTFDVVIDLSSSDTSEVTLSNSSVTFTPDNWNQNQTVTVSPMDDSLIDGSVESSIQISINDAASDNVYDPLAHQSITVTVEDNEIAVDLTFATYDRTASSVGDVIATYTGFGYGEEVTLGSKHFEINTATGEVSLTAAGASALAIGTLSTLGIRNGADSDYLVFERTDITDDVRVRAAANSGSGAADTAAINDIDKGVIRSAYFLADTDSFSLSATDTLFDAALELTLNASSSKSDGSFQTSDLSFVSWDDTDWSEDDALTTLAYATSDEEYTSLSQLNLLSGSIDETNTNATKYRLAYDISNAWDTTNPAALSFALFNSDTNRYQVHFSESSDAPSIEFTYRSDDLLVTSDDSLSVQEGTNSIGSPINLLDNDVLRDGLAGTQQLASINGKNWSQLTGSEHQLFTDELGFKELDVSGGTLYAKQDGRVFFEHDGNDLSSDLTTSINYTFATAIDEDGDGNSDITLNSSQGTLNLTIESGNQAPDLSLHVLDLVHNGTTWVTQGSATSSRNDVEVSSSETLTIAEFSISDPDSGDTHLTQWRSGSAPQTAGGSDFYALGNGVVTLTAAGKTAVEDGENLPTIDLAARDDSGAINALSTASATPHATDATGSVYYLDQTVTTEGANSTYSSLKELQKAVTLQGGDTVYLVGEHTNASYQSAFEFDGSDPAAVADSRIWGGQSEITLEINDVYGEPDNPVVFRPFNEQTVLKGDGPAVIQVKSSAFINVEGFNVEGMVQTDPTSNEGISLESAKQLQMLYRTLVDDGDQGEHLHYTDGTYNYYFRVYYEEGVNNGLFKPDGAEVWSYDDLHDHHENYDAGTLSSSNPDKVGRPLFDITSSAQRPVIIDTKGINVHSSYGVTVSDNTVSGMPGTGIQSAEGGAFLNFFNNDVSDSSRLSYTGTHGMQFYYPGNDRSDNSSMTASDTGYVGNFTDTQAASILESENTKNGSVYILRIEGNEVYQNYNGQFSWNATKEFIEPFLDEGKGISIQFANEKDGSGAWIGSTERILIADNTTYLNGLAGVQNHDSDRVDMLENVVFLNSIYSILGDQGVSNQIGLFHQGGDDPTIGGNIVVVDDGALNSDFSPIGASFVTSKDSDTTVTQTTKDADVVWALDGEVKPPDGGTYSDPSDLAMDPLLDLDNLDFTPVVGSQIYDRDVVFTEDTRVFLQVFNDSNSTITASTYSLTLNGDIVIDFTQLDETMISPGDTLDVIVADALYGQFVTSTFAGLSTVEAELNYFDSDYNGLPDILRVEFLA